MKRLRLALIVEIVLYAIICIVIYVAVLILSGEIESWKKLIIFAITFAILFPLVRYIKNIENENENIENMENHVHDACCLLPHLLQQR